MINIVKKELEFDDELKNKIEFICGFCNTTPTIINGNIRKIDRTNLSYIEPHRIIIKGITFLAFNYSKTIYVGNWIYVKFLDTNFRTILTVFKFIPIPLLVMGPQPSFIT